jgi:hypothetical protein
MDNKQKMLSIKVSQAWMEWAWGLANHQRLGLAQTVEHALMAMAKATNYPPPPERVNDRMPARKNGDGEA